MKRSLACHPKSDCPAVSGIEVEARRPAPGQLRLAFEVTGRIDELRLSPPADPVRRDGLWRTTCFEAFVAAMSGSAYSELNFAPSSAWAAYHFEAYRDGMQVAQDIEPPTIETRAASDRFELRASLTLDGLPRDEPWRLGLSAVIEDADGGLSYWALAHPPGEPDFHHADCFAAVLPSVLGTTSSK